MKKILILYDYRKFFATKFEGTVEKHTGSTMNVDTLKALFEKSGFDVETSAVSNLDYTRNYSDFYVIFPSSEDNGLFYKEYIEDVLCFLKKSGATLIPKFEYFRAHSNKSFQEMLRQQFSDESLKKPNARAIGHLQELENCLQTVKYPAVVKVSNGAGSKGVVLVNNEDELRATAKKLMKHTYHDFAMSPVVRLGVFIKRAIRILSNKRVNNETLLKRDYTNKIIIEEFIPSLNGDNKVLVFGDKYFVLSRGNRDKDFRASGSGKFKYSSDIKELTPVLDLAKRVSREIGMPVMSLDIGKNNDGVYLLEYQCLYFGPYTLQYAPHCFNEADNGWALEEGTFDLEREYVRAVSQYIKNLVD